MNKYKQVRLVKRGPTRDYVTMVCFLSEGDIDKAVGNVFSLKDDDRNWAIEHIWEDLTLTEEELQSVRRGWKSVEGVLK